MEDVFSLFDEIMTSAMKRMDEVVKEVDLHIADLKKKVESGEIKCRHFIVDENGELKELPMVPTTDKISFTKKPTKTSNVAPVKAKKIAIKDDVKPSKNETKSMLTIAEERKIRSFRKNGWSIKKIAKYLHRSDKTVAAFVNAESI